MLELSSVGSLLVDQRRICLYESLRDKIIQLVYIS